MSSWQVVESQKDAVIQKAGELQKKEMAKFVQEDDCNLKEQLKKDTWCICLSPLAGAVGIAGFVIFLNYGHWILGLIVLVMLICLMLVIAVHGVRHRTKVVKYSLVHCVLQKYFNPDVYLAYYRVPDDMLNEADIVDDWDKALASDYFSGTWKNVKFQFCDVTIYEGSGGCKKRNKVFSGQLFVIETGLELQTGITIHERKEPLSAEVYAGMKNSDRFFLTGNEQFDRQFDVHLGCSKNVIGFEQKQGGLSPEAQRQQAHDIVDRMIQDILDADCYAVSQTRMRFIGNRLYLSIENTRDTFELQRGDVKQIEEHKKRLDEEVRDMTLYLDLMTRSLEHLKSLKTKESSGVDA